MSETITLKIRRQDGPLAPATMRWELHAAPAEAVTVADALAAVEGLAWDDRCTWPRCGVCTMVIEGRARPACATRLSEVVNRRGTVTVEPLAGFPLRRDLWVDRRRLGEDAARFAPWLDEHPAPAQLDASRGFQACTRCGACLDACPEVRAGGPFVGAIAFGLSHLGRRLSSSPRRLEPLLDEGGIARCGRARTCVVVCPERIPLDEALGDASRQAARHGWRSLFSGGSGSDP